MNTLIIGCGRIFYKHLESINALRKKEIRIVGFCDKDTKKLKKLKKKYNLNTFTDFKKAIDHIKPHLVVILTPSGLHSEQILYALKKKCNVIVEKPMCLKILDAKKIVKLSKKYKRKVFVVMQNKFNLPVLKLRKDIQKGLFGKLIHGSVIVRWMRDKTYYNQAKWRGTWKLDGGVVSNQASHHLDLMRTIMGEPVSVYAKGFNHISKKETEDTALIIFKFKNRKTGLMEATTAMRPLNVEGSISIMGTKGSAKVGGFALNEITYSHFQQKTNNNKYKTNPKNVYGYGHIEFYKHVLESINKNKKSEFESHEAIKTVKLINAIYKSIEKNKEVYLNKDITSKKLGN
tara:strand:+ start:2221 stop:3258 length:1038 start_codon:yes stop_codon:yes gene_type:complete